MLWLVAYIAATLIVLVPSPLIEPRYFIIPYLMLRLQMRGQARGRVLAELVFSVAMNAVTMLIFLYKPYKWPQEEGWQRFMW